MKKPFGGSAEGFECDDNRGDRIRTCDLVDPNDAL